MIDNSVIYSNPIIRPSFYCANICKLEQEASEYLFPKLLIYLQIHPEQLEGDIILTSIIHSTPASEPYYNNFIFTFLRSDDEEIEKAVGRWGVVQVYNKEYEGTAYSVVRYVEQCGEYRDFVERVESEEQGVG